MSDSIDISWQTVLKALSLPRCHPFLTDAGLPDAVAAAPEGLADAASEQLRSPYTTTVRQFATRLADYYGEDVAKQVTSWCCDQINEKVRNTRHAWGMMLRYLAGFITEPEAEDSAEARTAPLDPALRAQVRDVVSAYLDSDRALAKRIDAARTMPRTAWEEELDRKLCESAGVAFSLSASELALDLIELAIANYQVTQMWATLASRLDPGELDQLRRAAQARARAFGIPVELLDAPPVAPD